MPLDISMLLVYIGFGLLAYFFIRRRWRMRKIYELSKKLENSYKALPLIGHAYMALGTNEGRMNVFKKFSYEAMKNKHGVTGAWIGMNFYVVVADAKVAEMLSKLVLAKSDMKALRHLTGKGSIFAPIDVWRIHRKMISPSFSERHLQMFIEIFAQQSLDTLNKLECVADMGTFSIWDHLVKYTMSTVSKSMFGINMQLGEHNTFLKAFAKYTEQVVVRMCQPWLRSDIVLKNLPLYEKLETNKRIIHNFIEQVIKKKHSEPVLKQSSPTNMMEMMMETSQRRNQSFSEEDLRDEVIVVILAATDTTAVAASFACLMLAMYPECQERAYKEIVEVCEDVRTPTADQLSKLNYLDAVIRETLRLCPPVPIIPRKSEINVELPTGLTIVRDCEILISTWGVHRNPRYWGSDAEEFNPDRFLNSPLQPKSSFMAFGYGPRNCIGYRFAMLSTKMLLSTILRRFQVIPPPSTQGPFDPMRVKYDIMLKHVNNFQVQLQRR